MVGFFRKALQAASAVSATPKQSKSNSGGAAKSEVMMTTEEVVVTFDPAGWADVLGPGPIELTPKQVPSGAEHRVRIVGEAYRQVSVGQVMAHYGEKGRFPIYLAHDTRNAHDKNAVGVYTGNVQVGFLDKDEARVWVKFVKAAAEQGQHLVGEGWMRPVHANKGSYWGVSGRISFGRLVAPDFDPATAKKLTAAAMTKALEKVQDLSADAEEPETAGQARSLGKKFSKAILPLYSHAVWMADNGDTEAAREVWGEVVDSGDALFDDTDANAYTTGDDLEGDLIGALEQFLDDWTKAAQQPE